MLIAIAFVAFAGMVASWLFAPDGKTTTEPSTTMVSAVAAAD